MARLDGLRVLLVEDARDVREVLQFLLEDEGAVVTATDSGLEAIDLEANGRFDIVLTDLGLTDISGEVVIRHVKEHSPWLRAVVVTGYGAPRTDRAKEAGADVIMTKPIMWSDLLDRMVPAPGKSKAA